MDRRRPLQKLLDGKIDFKNGAQLKYGEQVTKAAAEKSFTALAQLVELEGSEFPDDYNWVDFSREVIGRLLFSEIDFLDNSLLSDTLLYLFIVRAYLSGVSWNLTTPKELTLILSIELLYNGQSEQAIDMLKRHYGWAEL